MSSGAGALSGIRVIDFGQYLAGPLTAMFLADFGADVVRVDPPGGPRWDHPANAALQRGKRSIELDLKQPDGLETARRLVASADVVIEGFRPGVMDRLGLAPDAACRDNPGLIWCSLPGFGAADPRAGMPAWEGVLMAAAGLYPGTTFQVDGDPSFSALPFASNFGAYVAAHRIAAALIARHRYGGGEHIEVPLFDACFQAIGLNAEVPLSKPSYGGNTLAAMMSRQGLGYHLAADGRYVQNGGPLRGLQAVLDRFLPGTDLLEADEQTAHRIREELEAVWPTLSAAEWERLGQEELRATFSMVQSAEEWLHDDHALTSQCVVEVDDPELGPTREAGFPVLLSGTRASVRWPRRALDADRGDLLAELAAADTGSAGPGGQDAAGPGLPLDGIKVIDASILLAGPTATRVLAQYGAEVIKIENARIAWGDINPLSDDSSCMLGHRTVNAGKRMVFLDLRSDDGRRVARSLMSSADVVHHNFPPDTAQRLGLDLAQVRQLNARAVWSRVSLHSEGGYRSGYRGHDPLGQDVAGITHRLGGDGPPRKAGLLINDHATGHLAAFGILLALFHRYRTGEAQEVNAALSRTSTVFQMPFMVGFAGQVWDEPAGPRAMGWGPFDRLYRASDGWLYLACPDPEPLRRLARVPGLEQLAEVGPAEAETWLVSRLAKRPAAEWARALGAAGIGAHRYVEIAEQMTDDLAARRRLIAVVDHPGLGRALGIAHPVLGGPGPHAALLAARRPGMDTLDVLAEHGYAGQTAELLRKRVIGVGEDPGGVQTTTRDGYWASARDVVTLAPERSLPKILDHVRRASSPTLDADL